MSKATQRVVVLGASHKPERYSNQAIRLLRDHGHEVVPVHPKLAEAEGVPVVNSLDVIKGRVDTLLTMYVGADRSNQIVDAILKLQPDRVIFNPGSENPALETHLQSAGIPFELACTLLSTNRRRFVLI